MPGLDDSREGSPCRRAATELLMPGSFGEDVRPGEARPPVTCHTPQQGYVPPRQDYPAYYPGGFPGQPQWPGYTFPQQQQQPWGNGGPGFWDAERQRQAWYQHSAHYGQHPLQRTALEQYCMPPPQAFGPPQPLYYPPQQQQVRCRFGSSDELASTMTAGSFVVHT